MSEKYKRKEVFPEQPTWKVFANSKQQLGWTHHLMSLDSKVIENIRTTVPK